MKKLLNDDLLVLNGAKKLSEPYQRLNDKLVRVL